MTANHNTNVQPNAGPTVDLTGEQSPIYLDNQATTRVDPQVLETMLPYFGEKFGNASNNSHSVGAQAADAIEVARNQIASFLGVTSREIIFTSGATESNNLAIKGVMQATAAGSRVVSSVVEHHSVLGPLQRLQKSGFDVVKLPVDSVGQLDIDQIATVLTPTTRLVSIIWANNEVGTVNDMAAIGLLCRERGVLLHTDAAQAAGQLPIRDVIDSVDLLSLSGHKLYGPQGIGVLYVRRGSPRIRIQPLLEGGGQESGLRSGTLPLPLVVGMGAACERIEALREEEIPRIRKLRDRLWQGLSTEIDDAMLNGQFDNRLPGNLNVSFTNIDGDALMTSLPGLAVSAGAACASSKRESSHVLRAMGRSDSLARASLRFGIGRYNTESEIDQAIQIVSAAVTKLRSCTT